MRGVDEQRGRDFFELGSQVKTAVSSTTSRIAALAVLARHVHADFLRCPLAVGLHPERALDDHLAARGRSSNPTSSAISKTSSASDVLPVG